MGQTSGTIRAALVGTTAVLCLAATLFVGACAVRVQPDDFPVMRLTNPPAADAEPSR
ncbi:MAG TPA: hypothetical protein VHK26_01805 [Methyloceanibacter sp.]|nr:hypothetical protein [Methyloceanibacter sp.]